MPRIFGTIVAVCIPLVLAMAADQDAKYVKLVHVQTGKVLSVENESEEPAAQIVLAKDSSSKAQQWQLQKDGAFYKLVNRNSGKVLDVNGDSRDEEASIIQWDDKSEDNDNQRWSWEGDGEERRLKSKSSELMLDVDAGGVAVQRRLDKTAKSQFWRVSPVKE